MEPLLNKYNYAFRSSVNCKFTSGYNDGNLTINVFYQLTQLDCYYCGLQPSNKSNVIVKKSSFFTKLTSWFIYSGLDRIDNSRVHDYDNVIPCCKYCNYAKRDLTLNEFYDWINRLQKQKAETSSAF